MQTVDRLFNNAQVFRRVYLLCLCFLLQACTERDLQVQMLASQTLDVGLSTPANPTNKITGIPVSLALPKMADAASLKAEMFEIQNATREGDISCDSDTNVCSFLVSVAVENGVVASNVRIKLNAGNLNWRGSKRTFAIEEQNLTISIQIVPPTITSFVLKNGDAYSNSLSIPYIVTGERIAEVYVTEDATCNSGGAWGPASGNVAVLSGEGVKTFYLKAKDAAGNVTSCTLTDSIEVDLTAPEITVAAMPVSAGSMSSTFSWSLGYSGFSTISLSPSDIVLSGASVGCSVAVNGTGDSRNIVITNCSGNGPLSVTVNENTAQDEAGNHAAQLLLSPVTIDNIAPAVIITSPAENFQFPSRTQWASVSGTCSENGKTISFNWPTQSIVTCTADTWNALIDFSSAVSANSVSLTATLTDAVGHSSSISRTFLLPVVEIYSNLYSFAAVKGGKVITWGESSWGGNSSAVASDVSANVVKVASTSIAFAAVKANGSVATWGDSAAGGSSSTVVSQLSYGVKDVYGTGSAFAAVKVDGSGVTWGNGALGGDSSSVSAALTSVKSIVSNTGAFAAIKADGSVVTWGSSSIGGNSSTVASRLSSGVVSVKSNDGAFAALKSDGSVVAWGNSSNGSSLPAELVASTNVVKLFSNNFAFVALKSDSSIVAWGGGAGGLNGGITPSELTVPGAGVLEVVSSFSAFTAKKDDGSVVSWGSSDAGGVAPTEATTAGNIAAVFATQYAFAALTQDGRVIAWGGTACGSSNCGGTAPTSVTAVGSNVVKIFANRNAFAAIKSNGSVVTWGHPSYGGDSSSVAAALSSNVVKIYSTSKAFAAVKTDGTVVTWGDAGYGGDSSAVSAELAP
ncbi:hypothetical protein [Bdellovibrio bacteriovorus]|nr:hypothetical protein [Bdellovibrio bacteriovorus]